MVLLLDLALFVVPRSVDGIELSIFFAGCCAVLQFACHANCGRVRVSSYASQKDLLPWDVDPCGLYYSCI